MTSYSRDLAERILHGDRLALARTLTLIENNQPEGFTIQNQLYSHSGKAHLVGITGAPGTGKSTLVNRLALKLRSAGSAGESMQAARVAIVAVDPSSPFSGGAILGDRIRMRDLSGDPGIFIRSMASRGALGGVARTTGNFVEVLDAAGYDVILIETVGAGQAEVEIARTAHTTIVVDAPGLGDDVQAIKAGILEIADILIVNKSDLPGAENTLQALKAALTWASKPLPGNSGGDLHTPNPEDWELPVLPTIATRGEGVDEVVAAINRHRDFLQSTGVMHVRERVRVETQMQELLRTALLERFLASSRGELYPTLVERVINRELAPRLALKRLLDEAEI